MGAALPWSTGLPSPPPNDPNELLRRIDRNTTEMLRWVKYGFIVSIVLLLLITLAGI